MDPNANGLRDGAIIDLAVADTSAPTLTVWGEALDIDALRALPDLRGLEIYKLRARHLDRLAGLDTLPLQALSLRFWPVADLTALPIPPGLTEFTVWQSNPFVSLEGIERGGELKTVVLNDNGPLQSPMPLSALPKLRTLSIEGGIWNKQKIDTLDGLERLEVLEDFTLRTIDGRGLDLWPVARLPALRRLDLWARDFPLEEVAKVAAAFPFFHADLLELEDYALRDSYGVCDVCDATRKQMFIKGRKFLWCPQCDAKGLAKLLATFEAAVKKARVAYGRS